MNKKAALLSFIGGFLSLSIEVIYIRIFGFITHSLPQAFSLTLALFLFGIAIGSLIGKQLCKQELVSIPNIGHVFFIANLFDIVALCYFCVGNPSFWNAALCMVITAMLRGIVFPMVHHLGTEKVKTGAAISNVYFANVLGCTIAPIFVGFYLLDIFNTQQMYLLIITTTFVVIFFCVSKLWLKILSAIIGILTLISIFTLPETMIHNLGRYDGMTLETLIENKNGFIQVYDQEKTHDKFVFGNNVYDGKLNTSLIKDNNMVERAYLLPVIAPKAENILVVGLSTGSWVEVLAAIPNLKHMTVVEINPAYVDFAKFYPAMNHLLKDKRITVIADDGRRWLARHKDLKFDYILMNTTWYWRNYSTNLLSKEFLTLAKEHLNPDGFLSYNTTWFMDAFYTAKQVFPDVYQYENFAIASLKPIQPLTREKIETALNKMVWPYNQQPVFKDNNELKIGTNKILEHKLIPYDQIDFSRIHHPLEVITDHNMIPEYKYGGIGNQ